MAVHEGDQVRHPELDRAVRDAEADDGETLLGVVRRERPRDAAAPVVREVDGGGAAEVGEEGELVGDEGAEGVGFRGARGGGVPVAEQVRRDAVEAEGAEVGELVVPGGGGFGPAVQEDEEGPGGGARGEVGDCGFGGRGEGVAGGGWHCCCGGEGVEGE